MTLLIGPELIEAQEYIESMICIDDMTTLECGSIENVFACKLSIIGYFGKDQWYDMEVEGTKLILKLL